MNKEDIIARLAAGETMDEIAADLTKTLNAAATAYKEEQERERQNKKNMWLTAEAEDLATHINEFIAEYYPEYSNYEITGMEIVHFMETLKDVFNAFTDFGNLFNKDN